MVGSLNGVESGQNEGAVVSQERHGFVRTESTKPLSSGYDGSNSVSFSSEPDSVSNENAVALDSPGQGSGQLSSTDYLEKAFRARIEGFRSIFADFNAHYGAGTVDLSDTQTLLMVFRGMLKDIKVLNTAQAIDIASTQRKELQARRLEIAKLKLKIREREKEIDTLEKTLGLKKADILKKNGELAAKSSELASAQRASPLDQGLVNRLLQEVSQLQQDIIGLQNDISNLNAEILELKSLNHIDYLRIQFLEAYIQFFASLQLGSFEIGKLLFESLDQEGSVSINSGDKTLDEFVFEFQRLEKIFESEAGLQTIMDSLRQEREKELDGVSRKDVQPDELALTLEGILAPSLIKDIYSLISSGIPASESDSISIDRGVIDTTQALSVILLAEPPAVEDSEPGSQPYLGDSLALEGADNPTAFALLLLKERMGEKTELNPLFEGDADRNHYLAKLFDVESVVDEMVVNALKDSEQSEAAIRRASKA